MIRRSSIRWMHLAAAGLLSVAAVAQVADPSAERAALAPTGTLRAVFLATNPVQGRIDPETGAATGIAADIANELGRKLGVSVAIAAHAGVPAVTEAVRNGSADIGFLAYDPTRAQDVEFAQTYALGHNSYIVRADSAIRTLGDADREGVRIGARDGVSVDLFLGRTLQHAEHVHLPRATTDTAAVQLLLTGELDAYAANTERLAAVAANEPRVRVVEGSLISTQQSIVVVRGNATGVEYLNAFLDELRATGALQRIVDSYGLAGVEVAPPGTR